MPSQEPIRVGIVIRTKNRPWFLERALRDVSAQQDARWTVHIVNDGGDPASVDDAIAALPDDLRTRVGVSHFAQTRGRSSAANHGVRSLETEFVVLHDDDDLWHPAFLARTIAWLDAHPDDIGVMVRTEIVYESDRTGIFSEVGRAPMWPGLTDITYSAMLHLNRAVPISYLYRRHLHNTVGFYREDLDVVEDWEFNLRTTLIHHVGFIDGEPLAYWMQRAGVGGDVGNSVVVMQGEHDRFDRLVRDEALRAWVIENGPGLPLYLTRYVQDELARQLDSRRTLGQRLSGAVRDWRRSRRTR